MRWRGRSKPPGGEFNLPSHLYRWIGWDHFGKQLKEGEEKRSEVGGRKKYFQGFSALSCNFCMEGRRKAGEGREA